MGYPTFVAGVSAKDSLGRIDVDEIAKTIECGGVTVHHGDLILGDHDGVVVVPSAAAVEVLRLAEAKVATEDTVRTELGAGCLCPGGLRGTRDALRRRRARRSGGLGSRPVTTSHVPCRA